MSVFTETIFIEKHFILLLYTATTACVHQVHFTDGLDPVITVPRTKEKEEKEGDEDAGLLVRWFVGSQWRQGTVS